LKRASFKRLFVNIIRDYHKYCLSFIHSFIFTHFANRPNIITFASRTQPNFNKKSLTAPLTVNARYMAASPSAGNKPAGIPHTAKRQISFKQ